jgi:hypothetical protein
MIVPVYVKAMKMPGIIRTSEVSEYEIVIIPTAINTYPV